MEAAIIGYGIFGLCVATIATIAYLMFGDDF